MQTILSFTDTARDHIQSFLKPLGAEAGFRIGVKKTGCSGFSYLVDVVEKPRDQDLITKENTIPIFIDPACVDLIKGTVVDFAEKGTGQKQLIFNNPNAAALCGCGESFTVKED